MTPPDVRLAGFPGFLRANGFAAGGADAVPVLQTAQRVGLLDPQLLRWSLQALLCGRRDEWRRFDELFDAWFLPPNRWQQPERREAGSHGLDGERPDGTPADVPAIPAAAYNVAAQLIAREQGVDAAPARSRVHVGLPRWVTLKADRIAGAGPPEERDIVVTIEESGVADRRDLFSRCHGLTRREDEVLAVLLQGKDTRAIAAALFLSEHTVNDHVKAILAKTGCANRQVLLSRVAG